MIGFAYAALGVSILALIVTVPLLVKQVRLDRHNAEPIDWGDTVISPRLKEYTDSHVKATKLGDKRRITAPVTGIIQTIPEEITPLPVPESDVT